MARKCANLSVGTDEIHYFCIEFIILFIHLWMVCLTDYLIFLSSVHNNKLSLGLLTWQNSKNRID